MSVDQRENVRQIEQTRHRRPLSVPVHVQAGLIAHSRQPETGARFLYPPYLLGTFPYLLGTFPY